MATTETRVKITADASGVVKGVSVAQGALGKLQKQMGDLESLSAKGLSLSGLAGIGLSATAAAAGLVTLVRNAADYGDQLDNLSQRTGIAVEDLSRLQYAAKMSDTSTEALSKGLSNLSGLMVAAAQGAESSSALFQRFGISVRNADGSVRGAYDVMLDLADVFTTMPDGAEKSALAAEFFGKKLGVELIPLLNNGREGLKALGDEAERLGLVMSAEQAKAGAEFNDNLDKLAALAGTAGRSIGNALIPHVNNLLQKLLLAKDNGLSFGQVIFDVLPDELNIAEKIAKATAELEKLKKARQSATGDDATGIDEQIASQERLMAYLNAQRKKTESDDQASGAKRALMAGQLATKLAELEKLRAVASGKASADILKGDKELTDARIKDAERLRDALRAAYQQSAAEAKSAAAEAVKLLDQARAKRTGGADKAFNAETKGLSEEEKTAAANQRAEELAGQGRYAAAAAAAALLDGRMQAAEQYARQADELLDRASQFADQAGNADQIMAIAEAQAQLLEAKAKQKQGEAAAAEQQAAKQMELLNGVEAKLAELQKQAANFEIKANVSQLEVEIGRLREEIAKGAVMPITVQQQGAQKMEVLDTAPYGPGFESGGFTGWLGRQKVAGVVHGMEYVTPAGVTLQPGVLPFLESLRRYGNKVLPGYEAGGLVSRLSLPAASPAAVASPAARTPVVLDFGKLGRYQAEASSDTAAEITRVFRRAALTHGRR